MSILAIIYKGILFRIHARLTKYLIKPTLLKVHRAFLEERHVRNCQVVLNRELMLQKLGERKTAVELGVFQGDFSAKILEICNPDLLVLVDIWASKKYSESVYRDLMQRFSKEIKGKRIKICRKLSTDAASDFEDNQFDLVYIDTDHSYEVTLAELKAYSTKVKKEGVIAGHDYTRCYLSGGRSWVIEAVHEFCVQYNWEIIFITAETLESRSFAIKRIKDSV